MQFLPIKLPPVHGPPFFYKSTHIALDEIHIGNCTGLMVPTSKILGIGSPPNSLKYSLTVMLLIELYLEFLSLTGGCKVSSDTHRIFKRIAKTLIRLRVCSANQVDVKEILSLTTCAHKTNVLIFAQKLTAIVCKAEKNGKRFFFNCQK